MLKEPPRKTEELKKAHMQTKPTHALTHFSDGCKLEI